MKRLAVTCGVAASLVLLALLGCAPAATPAPAPELPSSNLIQAEPWPEADALFRTDPRWLGSDDAYSVDLGPGRTLWLFGDTFVSRSPFNTRWLATMIRNSVALQTGTDPSTASMAFYWRQAGGKPGSFFPEDSEEWYWPGHGIVLEGKLFVLLMATRASEEGLGFEHAGWRAVAISNPDRPPSEWDLEWLATPQNRFGLIVTGSVNQVGDKVYVFSVREPDHTVHLVRWPVARLLEGDLSRPEWWAGEENGWVRQQSLDQAPEALFAGGQTEFTIHHEPAMDRFLEIQTVGFGAADLGFRLADAPTGPWTSLERFYRPQEYEIPKILIYAAKAHPQLTGADLVLTYATNVLDFGRLVADEDLYYPRFLQASLGEQGGEGTTSPARR